MNFILKKITKRRWQLCCLLFFVAGCRAKSQYDFFTPPKTDSIIEEQKVTAALDTISHLKKIIHQGDLILRTGRDFTSETMRLLSARDKTYSHCGIASIENDTVFVYHSIGGEWNPDQKLRRDPFENFCNPFESRGFGIFRYELKPDENDRLKVVVQNFYKAGTRFDMQFDLVSDDRMYCTEFVYKAVKEATHERIEFPTTRLNHITFVATDNLFLNPACIEIKRVTFSR